MNNRDKPFIMYREGWGNVRIVPRGAAGWRETIVWLLMVVPIIGGFIGFALTDPKGVPLYIGLGLFAVAMGMWGIGGMVWMRGRAEVVDLQELLELKRQRDREKSKR
jgi:hypothetical protein